MNIDFISESFEEKKMSIPLEHRFPACVAHSDEDEGYVARIPAFPNCTGFGESPEDAIREVYSGLRSIINIMEQDGIPLPESDNSESPISETGENRQV